jgi:hypothetical protein
MGMLIKKVFDKVQEKGGIPLLCKMAIRTGITSLSAPTVPDAPETIAKVKKAFAELLPTESPPI